MATDNNPRVYELHITSVNLYPSAAPPVPRIRLVFDGGLTARSKREIDEAIKRGHIEVKVNPQHLA